MCASPSASTIRFRRPWPEPFVPPELFLGTAGHLLSSRWTSPVRRARCSSSYFFGAFFLPAIARLFPLCVRAFVLVL